MTSIIGYQIVSSDGHLILPEAFWPFEVISDISVAEAWLTLEKTNPQNGPFRWVLLPVFEGEIEDPVFVEYI